MIGFVGAKAQDYTMGLGPHIKFDHIRGEGVGSKGLPTQFLSVQNCLKDGLRRNVSSDVLNMAETCTLPAIKIHFNEN